MYSFQSFKITTFVLGTLFWPNLNPSIHVLGIKVEDEVVHFYYWDSTNGRIHFHHDLLDNDEETYFIIHGWSENSSVPIYETMAINYLKMDPNCNVILVDYERLAGYSYIRAFQIVEKAGKIIGKLMVGLIKSELLNPANTQIIGNSLGAHVSGRAARYVYEEVEQSIARIAALDPASPLFHFPTILSRLSNGLTKSDAIMVDATHTSVTMGTVVPFASVDFYVGFLGAHQPACQFSKLVSSWDEFLYCSHRMARVYFAESILSCGFYAKKVTWNLFQVKPEIIYGQHLPSSAKGIYMVPVNSKPPYAKNENTYPSCKSNIMF